MGSGSTGSTGSTGSVGFVGLSGVIGPSVSHGFVVPGRYLSSSSLGVTGVIGPSVLQAAIAEIGDNVRHSTKHIITGKILPTLFILQLPPHKKTYQKAPNSLLPCQQTQSHHIPWHLPLLCTRGKQNSFTFLPQLQWNLSFHCKSAQPLHPVVLGLRYTTQFHGHHLLQMRQQE